MRVCARLVLGSVLLNMRHKFISDQILRVDWILAHRARPRLHDPPPGAALVQGVLVFADVERLLAVGPAD